MRSALKILMTACAAAMLVASTASAKDAEPLAGYRVIQEDARIDYSITGFETVGREGLLVRSGGRLYLMRLQEGCARLINPPWWSIHVHPEGPTGVDHFAHVSINGQTCGVASIARVEREHLAAR